MCINIQVGKGKGKTCGVPNGFLSNQQRKGTHTPTHLVAGTKLCLVGRCRPAGHNGIQDDLIVPRLASVDKMATLAKPPKEGGTWLCVNRESGFLSWCSGVEHPTQKVSSLAKRRRPPGVESNSKPFLGSKITFISRSAPEGLRENKSRPCGSKAPPLVRTRTLSCPMPCDAPK